MSGVSAISGKQRISVNLKASKVIDEARLYATARRLKHTTCYHRYGSTIEFYIPDMFVDRFVNRAQNNGLDIIK